MEFVRLCGHSPRILVASALVGVIWLVALVPLASATYEPQRLPRFVPIGDERYFEPDDGAVVPILIDSRGDAALGPEASHAAARAAIAAWSDIADSTLRFLDAGFTEDLTRTCPGPNKILFNDPDGLLPPPQPDPEVPGQCRGVLALGISRTSTFEFKRIDGATYARTRCGFVVVADGWGGCSNWTPCNLAEAITHELGHVLGLAHSSERADEPDPLLRDAAMYYRAHFDGRCASLRADDASGVRFLYPTDLPVTIRSPATLPPGFRWIPYAQELLAAGGAGDYRWSLVRGNAPGLRIELDGTLAGTPERDGAQFVVARVEDARGDYHDKVLNIDIATPLTVPPSPSVTSTPLPTETPAATETPTASATSTPTATQVPTASATRTHTPPPPTATATVTVPSACAGDCDGSGSVSVDEIVRLIALALGADGERCPAGDGDGDGRITVDEIVRAVDNALRGCG